MKSAFFVQIILHIFTKEQLPKILFLCFFIALFSCQKEKEIDPCLVDPLASNATLKRIVALEEKHNLDSSSVLLYTQTDAITKQNKNYFIITNTSPILKYNFIANAEIINCDGNDIAEFFDKNDYDEFFKTAKYVKRIWKKERSQQKETKGTCNTLQPLTDLPYFVKLNTNLEKYAWKALIYQYSYKGQTVYYGLYTPIDRKDTKYVSLAAMTCDGSNLQDMANWSQADFLQNAQLERQIR
jgi:hypothetical protein